MKKQMMLVAMGLAVSVASAVTDVSGWKRLEHGTASFNHVLDPDLDDPTFRLPDGKNKVWKISREGSIDAAYGFNQRGIGIVRAASETNAYSISAQWVKTLKPNTRYEFGCKVKAADSDGRTSASLGLEGLAVPVYKAWSGNFDWTDCKVEFTTTEKNDPLAIVLFIRKGRWCTAMYDNFYVREVGGEYVVGLYNPFGRVDAEWPKLKFGANVIGDISYPGHEAARLIAIVRMKDAAGKTAFEGEVPVKGTRFSVDPAGVKDGVYDLTVTLADAANRLVLTEETGIRVQIGTPDVPKPARGAVTIDRFGRTLVDGKPFMPIAMYMGNVSLYEMDWLKASDFNSILSYSGFGTRIRQTKKRTAAEQLREDLDFLDRAGLKIILGSKSFFPKFDADVGSLMKEWGFEKGKTDYETFLAHCTESIKDHPALLGYYITDELPPERYRELMVRRTTHNRVDPWHPTTGVYFRLAEMASYTGVTETPSIDFYPISGTEEQSQRLVVNSMDVANAIWADEENGQMPFWATLQMFSWGGSNRDRNKRYRMPTERESIAMVFMSAIGGAKGFIWYYFTDICHVQADTPAVKFPRFEENWRTFREVAHETKLLEPFVLSTKPGPKVTVKEVKGHVRARAFVDDEYGRLRVLVACEGPGESEAEIEVEGEKTLLAKFANTVAERTKDGRTVYRFKGKGVDCDLLQRWPELEFNKDLEK